MLQAYGQPLLLMPPLQPATLFQGPGPMPPAYTPISSQAQLNTMLRLESSTANDTTTGLYETPPNHTPLLMHPFIESAQPGLRLVNVTMLYNVTTVLSSHNSKVLTKKEQLSKAKEISIENATCVEVITAFLKTHDLVDKYSPGVNLGPPFKFWWTRVTYAICCYNFLCTEIFGTGKIQHLQLWWIQTGMLYWGELQTKRKWRNARFSSNLILI